MKDSYCHGPQKQLRLTLTRSAEAQSPLICRSRVSLRFKLAYASQPDPFLLSVPPLGETNEWNVSNEL